MSTPPVPCDKPNLGSATLTFSWLTPTHARIGRTASNRGRYGKASGGRYIEVEARYFVGRVEDPRKMAATEAEIKASVSFSEFALLTF